MNTLQIGGIKMTATIKQDFAKEKLYSKGLNITLLAKRTDVSVSYMSMIFKNKRSPSPTLAKKISDVLDVSIEDIFEIKSKEG